MPEESQTRSVVLLLGSFHTSMNLLGTIGTFMDGSGIKNVLEAINSKNAVHIFGFSASKSHRSELITDFCTVLGDVWD